MASGYCSCASSSTSTCLIALSMPDSSWKTVKPLQLDKRVWQTSSSAAARSKLLHQPLKPVLVCSMGDQGDGSRTVAVATRHSLLLLAVQLQSQLACQQGNLRRRYQ